MSTRAKRPVGWVVAADGAEAVLHVRALALPFSTFVALLVGTIVCAGTAAVALLIALTGADRDWLPRWQVVWISAVMGIAAFFVLAAVLRVSAGTLHLRVTPHGLTAALGSRDVDLPWSAVTRLMLRSGTDYARVHIAGASRPLTALIGAAALVGYRAGIEDVSPPECVLTWCAEAGLRNRADPRRHPGMLDLQRGVA